MIQQLRVLIAPSNLSQVLGVPISLREQEEQKELDRENEEKEEEWHIRKFTVYPLSTPPSSPHKLTSPADLLPCCVIFRKSRPPRDTNQVGQNKI